MNDTTQKRMNAFVKVCIVCAKVPPGGSTFTCKQCGRGRYCGAECQKKHWKSTHRRVCRALAAILQRPRVPLPVERPVLDPPLRAHHTRIPPESAAAARSALAASAPSAVSTWTRGCADSVAAAAMRMMLASPSSPMSTSMLVSLANPVGWESSGGASTASAGFHALLGAGVSPDASISTGSSGIMCALTVAATSPVMANVSMLLACGAHPDGPPGVKPVLPPIVMAIVTGKTAAVRLLLEAGADPNLVPNDAGCATPLLTCVDAMSPTLHHARDLVAAGINPVESARACALLLLSAGADVNAPFPLDRGDHARRTPLLAATALGDAALPLVDLFLAWGADTEVADSEGRTSLVLAAIALLPAPRLIQRLLRAGANAAPPPRPGVVVGPGDITFPYVYALARSPRRLESLVAVLEAGADPNEFVTAGPDPDGKLCGLWTPLALALLEGEGSGVDALLAWGACPLTPVGTRRPPLATTMEQISSQIASLGRRPQAPSSCLYIAVDNGLSRAFNALVAAGASIADAGFEGAAALEMATRLCDSSVVRALVSAGAPLRGTFYAPVSEFERVSHAISGVGTPFGNALQFGDAPSLQALLDAGLGTPRDWDVALQLVDEKITPIGAMGMVCSSSVGSPGMVELLLSHPSTRRDASAVLNRRDRGGRTCLWHAAAKGHGALVLELLRAGADPSLVCPDGWSPVALMEASVAKPRNRSPERAAEAAAALSALRERTRGASRGRAESKRAAGSAAAKHGGAASDGEENHPRNRYFRIHDDDAYAAVGTNNAAGMSAYIKAETSKRTGDVIMRTSLETLAASRVTMPVASRETDKLGSALTPEDVARIFSSLDMSGMVDEARKGRRRA